MGLWSGPKAVYKLLKQIKSPRTYYLKKCRTIYRFPSTIFDGRFCVFCTHNTKVCNEHAIIVHQSLTIQFFRGHQVDANQE